MATQAGLARFFVPANKDKASSPQTPASKQGGIGKSGAEDAASQVTPPSTSEARKRTASAKGGSTSAAASRSAKKPRGVVSQASADTSSDQGNAEPLPLEQAEGPPMDSPAQVPTTSAPPADLRATLQLAQRSSNSLPVHLAECFHHYENGGQQYSWPAWMKPENFRDAKGLRPSEPGFNGGTMWVPKPEDKAAYAKEPGHNTPMLLQYWKLKANHFDKIALFKVGKFYEVFYYDAFMAQRVCNLKWMAGDKKPHVGFPEMAKHDYAKRLVDAGYKVVVVEQVERVVETNQRKESSEKSSGPTCVERDTCEVYTRGTLVDPEMLGGSGARFMVYLYFEDAAAAGLNFAACLVDCATSQIQLGRVADAADRNALRTLLAQVQPSEVIYDAANLPAEVLQLLRRLPCRPQLSPTQGAGDRGLLAARDRLNRYRHASPKALTQSVEAVLSAQDSATLAASGAMEYLEVVLLGQRVLPFATWDVLEIAAAQNALNEPKDASKARCPQRMILDATALSALELLETSEGTHDGCLMAFLDRTSTPFGFRLLKQWICAPLCNIQEIKARQDSVEFFIQRSDLAQQISHGLKKLPVDLERATSRIWSYALQAERKAVMYEDVTARRLRNFTELLESYEQCLTLLNAAFPPNTPSLPGRLASVARPMANGGSLPDLMPIIARLKGSVIQAPGKNGVVKHRPQDGADEKYDQISRQIDMTLGQLEKELQGIRAKHPKVQFTYMHRLPGFRYEVECEEQALPAAFLQKADVTYRSKGKVRFHTERIKELIAQLDNLENSREDCIFPFLSKLFRDFHNHQAPFRAALRCIGELDALLSLAAASRSLAGDSCKAEFVELKPEEPGCLELRDCRHPVAASKMGNSFVPNDTVMNATGVPGVLVVTGPNMGGKSTVLRQTCLAVVMAQLGCRVNAKRCRLSPVDRVFTRIGAYDAVLEGKSTLLTELEETAAILAHGTRRSLAVLDELGRGTSTFDGAAIAAAVLDELIQNVGCMVMFATHYHPVSREAACDTVRVAPFHMSAAVDPSTNEMTFLYKFLAGLCPASHGHHVAKIAGLPTKVLQEALERSAEFESSSAPAVAEEEFAELARLAAQGDEAGLRCFFRKRKTPA
eukprot:TRINITY_DN1814_c2_g5_i1.p1 TRINITY_DN1814_c2_g5~~TRINITY_DN1814_c2_g5_i1.p1  ORF type:complete len:1116 (+),score=272.77 TRINITY_DN1814_c2_g5_i1:55-3402(+)